jgi:hypothetical protein
MISRVGVLQPTISIAENSKNQQVFSLFSAVLPRMTLVQLGNASEP